MQALGSLTELANANMDRALPAAPLAYTQAAAFVVRLAEKRDALHVAGGPQPGCVRGARG